MTDTREWTEFACTVGDLRGDLAGLPDDMPVILEKDAEGNGYSPLSMVLVKGYRYHPDSTYSGEITSGDDCYDNEDFEVTGSCPHDTCRHSQGTPVIVLGPLN